jgi:hypothetical protein
MCRPTTPCPTTTGDAVRQPRPLFERFHVDLVLNGHNHNYQRSIVSITYVVTGGAGGELNYIEVAGRTEAYYNGHHLVHFRQRLHLTAQAMHWTGRSSTRLRSKPATC